MKMHNKIGTIIGFWAEDHFFNTESGRHMLISFEVYGRNIYIYTDHPGWVVGYHGSCINDLKNKLKEYKIHKKVNVIEIGSSGHVREVRIKRKFF